MIVFKTLAWKNFLSTGSVWTEIKLDANSNTLIVGKNGAGKSTILESLCFVLFGSPFRKINKPNLVNSINGKDCVVSVEFTTGSKSYKIVRGIKPSIFEVYCDDVLVDQTSSGEYQDYLERYILRMNKKSFVQIVILGAQSFTPFMQLKAADRREIIEDLLDIGIFSTMNLITKQKLTTNKENVERLRTEIKALEDKGEYLSKIITSLQADNVAKIESLVESKKEYEQKLKQCKVDEKELETEINEYLGKIKNDKSLRDKHKKLIALQSGIETNLKRHQKHIEFYRDQDTCPTCKQDLEITFKTKIVEETELEASNYTEGLKNITDEIHKVVTSISQIDEYLKQIDKLQAAQMVNTSEAQMHSNVIHRIDKEIAILSTADKLTIENKAELKQTIKQLKTNNNRLEQLLDERTYLDLVISLLKDGGIKTKIIKKYLPIINKQINKYLSDMDFFVNFNIDENFEEKILSRHRDSFQYDNFSNGEKMRIDLAILFTWRAIARMRNSVNTNLLILDEVFDSSLDDAGVDEFIKIIQSLTNDQNVFIISHKGDLLYDKFDNVIKFEKQNGFSGVVI